MRLYRCYLGHYHVRRRAVCRRPRHGTSVISRLYTLPSALPSSPWRRVDADWKEWSGVITPTSMGGH